MRDPEQLWYDLVHRFASQSRCKSRQVGAIIVKDNHLVAEGWNSAPKGSSTDACPRAKCRGEEQASGAGLDSAICCHAEANAIGNCSKRGVATDGASLFCTTLPCAECAKLIVAAGIREVVFGSQYASTLTYKIFERAMIECRPFSLGVRNEHNP